ncbi:WecB/TagA/CpsF family glycosyltransferase [Planosporangium thailandense]|uniref:WecB/TagA/CpsF family glycosyltransferase n=1 Tax=Planosporangium thailandense TaxID=765197 RepID=A0ABX0XYE8_9ACTN|nr:WecB/TagA/CpsF family glycosyltransferase [Planosporangium thailandense]NJC70223.1 WecB/TagA/CpsF family glycosyltransferase [Planosporangium thailandense]
MEQRVVLDGVGIDRRTEAEIVAHVRESLSRCRGGRIVAPTVDLLRLARRDPDLRAQLADADLVVADSTPLLWASRLARAPLPERVAGLSLARSLAAALAADGRSLYLFGGAPAFFGRIEGSHRAARALVHAYPGLRIAGHASPREGFDRDPATRDAFHREIVEARPDVVYVGLGASTYAWLAERLRHDLPGAWLLGCGAAIDALAGDHVRVRERVRRRGREWAHRLVREPSQLADRYLCHDGPYALGLLLRAAVRRR